MGGGLFLGDSPQTPVLVLQLIWFCYMCPLAIIERQGCQLGIVPCITREMVDNRRSSLARSPAAAHRSGWDAVSAIWRSHRLAGGALLYHDRQARAILPAVA